MSDAPWLDRARKYVGLKEIIGSKHEKEIVRFFADAGHTEVHDDETAWCAAFVGAMLARAGFKSTKSLLARSYATFGVEDEDPKPGTIVVLKRGNSSWQGHVGFYVSGTKTSVRILGGNQSNSVSIQSFPRSSVIAFRWPTEKIKPLRGSKIATGAATVGTAETVDAGLQVEDAISKARDVKDVAEGFGLTDIFMRLATNPRFWVAVVAVLICAAIVYWRWRDYGRGGSE
jgi:uncharacterized protein (TIGR02594 family)